MIQENNKKCILIGAGIGGIAASIRMRNKGFKVIVFESNTFFGGKLSEEKNEGYRFDMGPSVFTMPQYVDELFSLSGKNPRDYFKYKPLTPVYRYFFEDGTVINSFNGKELYSQEVAKNTIDSKGQILDYLNKTEQIYKLTDEVFLQNSLHKVKNYFTKAVAKGIINFGKIGAFTTMNDANEKAFKDKKLTQIFNRYATYNGSSPYLAPATLNVIPHLEIMGGTYYPEGGMYSIAKALVKLAEDIGVDFKFSSKVSEIVVDNKIAKGVRVGEELYLADVVISNMDIFNSYKYLLPNEKKPLKILNQPKSSSAIVFYWGIKKEFKELNLHNIFFSENYREEFAAIFEKKSIYSDPTIYLNITSKYTKTDAPEGCENWFAMINVPHNEGQDWDKLIAEARQNVIRKINNVLKTDITSFIECEMIFDPRIIESRTASAFGAIYGNSSNNKFAAFMRHPNFSKKIKNLYFCGGSVHPGPSIPLCLLSAKITSDLVK